MLLHWERLEINKQTNKKIKKKDGDKYSLFSSLSFRIWKYLNEAPSQHAQPPQKSQPNHTLPTKIHIHVGSPTG